MKTIALCLALVGVGNAQSLLTSQTQECRYVGKDWVCNLYHAPKEFYREKKSTPTHARQSIPATYPDHMEPTCFYDALGDGRFVKAFCIMLPPPAKHHTSAPQPHKSHARRKVKR